jgi:hypothetical protein
LPLQKVRMGMGQVDPVGRWPDPKKQGHWASWVGLMWKLGQWSRHRSTRRASRVDPGLQLH